MNPARPIQHPEKLIQVSLGLFLLKASDDLPSISNCSGHRLFVRVPQCFESISDHFEAAGTHIFGE